MARTIVTGARRGIGREIALSLARGGHTVVATMRNTEGCDLIDIARRENLCSRFASRRIVAEHTAQRTVAGQHNQSWRGVLVHATPHRVPDGGHVLPFVEEHRKWVSYRGVRVGADDCRLRLAI